MNTELAESKTSSTTRDLIRRIKGDFRWYAGRCLSIKTKDERIQRLDFNDTQNLLDERWTADEAAGKAIRYIILKARQEGVSTYVEGRFFNRTTTRKNRTAVVVSHDEDSTAHLFEMVKLYRDGLPDSLLPMQRYSNRRELVFENPSDNARRDKPGLRSRLSVALARNLRAGRSKTIHDLHLSEAAFYPDLRTFLTGILQAVPNLPGTAIIIESTANGIGAEFHRLWEASKRGETPFTPLFFPWFVHREYRLPFASVEDRDRFEKSLTAEERKAQTTYGLELEQLQWRREKVKEFDSIDLFLQEYPENDVDCFLSSGSPALPVQALREMRKTTTLPKWRGFLETYMDERDPKNPVEKIRFVVDPKGPLSIWKMPQAEGQYAIGADTSEGIAGGDYSSVDVFDKETSEQVAQWHGLIDPDLLGSEVLTNLGWYYRNAEVGVERNNHGLTVLVALKKSGYSNLFRSVQVDERTNKAMNKLGWLTTSKTKPLMVDELRQRIRERSIVINAAATIDECLTFVRQPNGTTSAQENCKDDRVVSAGVTLQVMKHNPYITRHRRRAVEPAYDSVTGY